MGLSRAGLCVLLLLAGCGGGEDARAFLSVTLRSDLGGGEDFAVVITELVSDDGAARSKTMEASADMNFVDGVVVARWDGLPHGNYALRIKLVGSDGRLAAQSDRVVTLTRSFESVLTVNRQSCTAVTCNGGTTCLNGACVITTCITNPSAPECKPIMPDPEDAGMMCTDCDGSITACTTGQSRACTNTNASGTCAGTQMCTDDTWGACGARTPAPEIADGMDNDCDGATDEGTCVPSHSCQPLDQCTSIDDGCGTTLACPCPGGPYEGRLVAATDRPLAFVTTGKRINFERFEPATYLSNQDHLVLDQGTYDSIASMANMNSGATVIAAGGPAGFILSDNRLYVTDCLGIVTADNSTITTVSSEVLHAYARGPTLHCVQ